MDPWLVNALEDPSRYHYKDLWLEETDPERRKALELFAFGTVQHIDKSIPLTTPMLRKLQKLTIVSLSERLREIPYELIRQECGINDTATIEECLIQLREFFEVQLDSPAQQATILRWYDCRDVYGGERPLVVVPEPATTSASLLKDLESWHRKLQLEIVGQSSCVSRVLK